MKIKQLFISSLLVASLSAPAFADEIAMDELASPLITLIPAFKKVRDDLKLDEKQNKTVDAWMTEAPAKKKNLKKEVLAIRAELRAAILNRDTRTKRDALKVKLGQATSRVIEMQSLCARMLHNTLTKEQYAKVVAQYKDSSKS
ncbi:MAG: hypothetical protein L3J46_07145 [Kangiellaceae bacterium]|nr:hypothetical protein [Kangiellaceae bacterium]